MDGNTYSHLTKRRLVFEVVKAALAKGFPPEQIANLVPPNKWISVDGELTAEGFQDKASNLQAKLGGRYNLRRYFCDDGELFHITGRTYALSNQWSANTISFALEGFVNPLNFRTNWTEEARISSSVAGGSKLCKVLMFRHMSPPRDSAFTPDGREIHHRNPKPRAGLSL